MSSFRFKLPEDIAVISVEDLLPMIEDILYKAASAFTVSLKDIIIAYDDHSELKSIKTIDDIIRLRIPILDFFMYMKYFRGKDIEYASKQMDKHIVYNFTILSKAIFNLYFMIMTRSKAYLEKDEELPKFIREYVGFDDKNYLRMISSNTILDKIDHVWIKNVKIWNFQKPVKQRLSTGITGCRILNVLLNNEPDKMNFGKEVRRAYELIVNQFRGNLYLELHPYFMPM